MCWSMRVLLLLLPVLVAGCGGEDEGDGGSPYAVPADPAALEPGTSAAPSSGGSTLGPEGASEAEAGPGHGR